MTKNISLHIKQKTYITTNTCFLVDKQSTYNVIPLSFRKPFLLIELKVTSVKYLPNA